MQGTVLPRTEATTTTATATTIAPSPPGRAGARETFGLFAGAVLLAALYLRTGLLHLADGVIGGRSDGYENLWNDWWLRESLFRLHANPFFTAYAEYPTGTSLRFHTLDPFGAAFTLPLWPLVGSVAATNLRVVFAFVACVFIVALLIRDIVRQPLAAFAGAAVFTYANHEMIFNYQRGTANYLLGMCLLPLYILFLRRGVTRPRSLPPCILASMTLLALSLTDWQYTLFAVVFTLLYFAYALAVWRDAAAIRALFVKLAAIGAAWAAVVLVPLVLPMTREIAANPWLSVSGQTITYGRGLSMFADLGPENPGYAVLLVALGGLVLWWRARPTREERREAGLWVVVGLVAAILSLGPVLKLTAETGTGIPLPYALLANLPLLSVGRKVHLFYTALSMLAVGVLFAFALMGWFGLLGRVRLGLAPSRVRYRLGSVAPAAFTAVALVAALAPSAIEAGAVDIIPMQTPAFYRDVLAKDPERYAILEVPLFVTQRGRSAALYQAYQSVHGKQVFGSSIARNHKAERPDLFVKTATLYRDYFWINKAPITEMYRPPKGDFLPTPDYAEVGLPLLNYYNVRYLVLYLDALRDTGPTATSDARALVRDTLGEGARPVFTDALTEIYRVPAAPPAANPVFLDTGADGWYAAERTPQGTPYRWADKGDGAPAELLVWNLTQGRQTARLQLTAYNYKRERGLSVAFNDARVDAFRLPSEGSRAVSLVLDLPPGLSRLTITSPEPPMPVEGAKGKDNRLLSFGVRDLLLSPGG